MIDRRPSEVPRRSTVQHTLGEDGMRQGYLAGVQMGVMSLLQIEAVEHLAFGMWRGIRNGRSSKSCRVNIGPHATFTGMVLPVSCERKRKDMRTDSDEKEGKPLVDSQAAR